MKLVSPKNLLVSLLGCAFVVLKIVTFDGVADLFWILFIGTCPSSVWPRDCPRKPMTKI